MSKKRKISDPLAELHSIREKNYKETKNMSPSEYINHIRKKAQKVFKHLKNFKIISSPEDFYLEINKKRKIS